MDHAERRVTVTDLIGRDDADGNEVVDLIETDLLPAQFLPDRIKSFDAAFYQDERHFRLVHLLFNACGYARYERFVLRTPLLELFREFTIVVRMQVTKREIFEFASQLTHAQPVRDRREDVHRLFGDALSFFRIEIVKRTHVVQPIGELHQHDADVVDHCQQHFANVLGLLFFARDVADLRNLRKSVDEVSDLFAEVTPDRVEIDKRVFYDIV